jgi:hypothetical protein
METLAENGFFRLFAPAQFNYLWRVGIFAV